MDQKILIELKDILEQEKKTLIAELNTFAQPDQELAGNWDAKYLDLGNDQEDNSQETTEYATRLPLEHQLEKRLQDIEEALKKLDQGTYGFCEVCSELIDIARLRVNPEARTCVKHAV